MRVASSPGSEPALLQSWPPLLALRGPGGHSRPHAHHAMHVVLCRQGELQVRGQRGRWTRAAGVVTAPDAQHEIDARSREVLLVFIDPESEAGAALRPMLAGPVLGLSAEARDALVAAEPLDLMQTGGRPWLDRVLAALGAQPLRARPPGHPRVRRLLRRLRELPAEADVSLAALAVSAGLSPGRLMHVFTTSVGLPLRPYLAWLRLQRAASAIAAGRPLSRAAAEAGFADAAHMSRTVVRMLGVTPSALRPRS